MVQIATISEKNICCFWHITYLKNQEFEKRKGGGYYLLKPIMKLND